MGQVKSPSDPHSHTAKVEAKQKWLAPSSLEPVRVMAVAEGYALVRHKGCMPFVLPTKRMLDLYTRMP